MSLLNAMLNDTSEEEEKNKELIRKLGGLLKDFSLLMGHILAVSLVAISPIALYLHLKSIPLSELSFSSLPTILCMTLGGIIPFALKRNKQSTDYSAWSKLLHRMILDNGHIAKSLFQLEKKLYKSKLKNRDESFVIVTGLARSGTTALTHILHRCGGFSSLSYANMPFFVKYKFMEKNLQS